MFCPLTIPHIHTHTHTHIYICIETETESRIKPKINKTFLPPPLSSMTISFTYL